MTVYAIDTSTATKTWLWDSRQSPVYDNDTEGSWSLVTIDLKAAGFRNKNIKLEFTFDAASTGSNSYEGVYLDSISVTIGTTSKFSEGFESNTDQWVIDTYGLEDVFWQRETYRKYAGSWSLYFGNPSIRMFRTKTKWEIAKAALIQMVGDNKDRVKFALASFANNGSCGVDATYDVSLGGDEIDFQTALNGLSPYSNTPIATAISPSNRSTRSRASVARRTHMLLTARHDTPYRSAAACLLPTIASWTTRSSNARENREP